MRALWMVLGTFFFALMAVCVKFASDHFNVAELVFYRGLIGMIFIFAIARSKKVSLATRYPAMHAWRSLVGVASLGAWFFAISAMPIATATTLNYMSSIWVALFVLVSGLFHWRPSADQPKPPLHAGLIATILGGFAGVVLVLSPSYEVRTDFLPALLGFLSGMMAALAYMQVVVLARIGEPETRVVFYFAAGSTFTGAVLMLFMGASNLWQLNALWLIPIGIAAALGQLCMTYAYSTAASPENTLVVASLQYFGIVFGALFSVLLFKDAIGWKGWLGMAVIIVSGVTATVLRVRASKAA